MLDLGVVEVRVVQGVEEFPAVGSETDKGAIRISLSAFVNLLLEFSESIKEERF